jgi:hypothetical protein
MEEKKQYPKVYTKNLQGKNGTFKKTKIIISDPLTQSAIYKDEKGQLILELLQFPTENNKYSDDNVVFGKPYDFAYKKADVQVVESVMDTEIDPSTLPF